MTLIRIDTLLHVILNMCNMEKQLIVIMHWKEFCWHFDKLFCQISIKKVYKQIR
jgi:hypothetical protein